MPALNVLGLDFGTSNTVAVIASDGRPPRVVAIDGTGWVPSGVFAESDGTFAVGREAERRAKAAPERFEPHPKRRIDDGELLLGVRVVPVVEAIAAVLRRVAEEVRRQLNGKSPDEVHLTYPAAWESARKAVLLRAAELAGLGERVVLIPEPVAAATHFASLPGHRPSQGSALAVFDLGGGTLDVAIVAVESMRGSAPRFVVTAESGLADLGGVDFDHAILEHLGRSVSATDPARWQSVVRPRTGGDRRAALALREDGRAAKETLSRMAQADVPLPDPFEDTLLTREEFEGLIRPLVARCVDVLTETIRVAGRTPDQLLGIYLVGGSSRIPLIATMIAERLGVMPITLDQPETSVAMGAALAPAERQGAGPAVVMPPIPGQGPTPSRAPGDQTGVYRGPGTGAGQRAQTGGGPQVPPRGPAPQSPDHRTPQAPDRRAPGWPDRTAGQPAQFAGGPQAFAPAQQRRGSSPALWIAVAAVAVVAVVLTLVFTLGGGGGSGGNTAGGSTPSGQGGMTTPVGQGGIPTEVGQGGGTTPVGQGGQTPDGSVTCSAPDSTGRTDCLRVLGGPFMDDSYVECANSLDGMTDSELRSAFEQNTSALTVCLDRDDQKRWWAAFGLEYRDQAAFDTIASVFDSRVSVEESGIMTYAGDQISVYYSSGTYTHPLDGSNQEGTVVWVDPTARSIIVVIGLEGTGSTATGVREFVAQSMMATMVPE